MNYRGSCHCGKVAFEVEGDISGVIACNCSICQRKGSWLWFVPRNAVQLLTPESNTSIYTFRSHVIKHRFCRVCGIQPYSDGTDQKGNAMAAINVRCLEDVDLASVQVTPYDGRSK